jgi:3-isopropylmalate/(R)-2-methylmalate dehydratase large subunit
MKGTLAQKILASASGKTEVKTGEYVTANIDRAMVQDAGMQTVYPILKEAGIAEVWDPSRVVCVIDHQVPAPNVKTAELYKEVREAVKRLGIRNFFSEGSFAQGDVRGLIKGWDCAFA